MLGQRAAVLRGGVRGRLSRARLVTDSGPLLRVIIQLWR